MEAITIINILMVLVLAAGSKFGLKRSLMPVVCIIMICFFGIRYNYGNDYPSYESMFRVIGSNSVETVRKYRIGLEYGWIYINKWMQPFGFQALVFIHTAIQMGTACWFINKYASVKWQWAIFALYVFWPALMLTQLSMMRQTVAMCIVMWGIPFLLKRKYLIFCLFPLLAAQFHTSGYIGFLFIIIFLIRKWDYRWLMLIYVTVFFAFYLTPAWVVALIDQALDNKTLTKYNYYMSEAKTLTQMRTGMGFIYQALYALFLVFIMKYKSTDKRFFILSLVVYYVTTPLSGSIGNLNRLFLYLLLPGIVSFQPMAERSRHDAMAMALLIGFSFFIIFSYNYFFYDPIYTKYFREYQTIFSTNAY